MPTWDLLSDKEKKKYLEEAAKAATILKETCESDDGYGYCLKLKSMCYYNEDQISCLEYFPSQIDMGDGGVVR